ncbi:hypothetical protein FJ414_18975 [Mesorhizobium sp. B3-1-6]|uniref:hypothetical protein n=1 Tax=Mesorhizobium sp. B3-1-6 TaxID=2589895 RepID=UPI0011266F16|nr:hypothetical protein [Mesorhizobium sp. B3-1-6]TPI34699.1 hypothetical protein FJ414_18975 [Mesorhizobium sp. B3-1-6]
MNDLHLPCQKTISMLIPNDHGRTGLCCELRDSFPMSDESDLQIILDFIKNLVDNYWNDTGNPLLLSSLGWSIRQRFDNSDVVFENGLKRFLLDHPVVQVVTDPIIAQKVGAVPLGVALPEDVSELFRDAERSVVTKEKKPRLYSQDFWNLFVYGFSNKRFVIVDYRSNTWRISETDATTEGQKAYEIVQSDVVALPRETPMSVKVPAVHDAISKWLTRNGLNREMFENRLTKQPTAKEEQTSLTLEAAFSKLDPVDLSRISIPLDLVRKMLSGR